MVRISSSAGAAALALALLTVPAPLAAQTAGGTISGRITLEASGDPVHGATVIVVGARRQATTGEDGRFEIRNVPPGTYDVLAQREHFSAARQSVTIAPSQALTVDFRLALAGVHEEVTVTASATGAATTFESFNSITSLDIVELTRNRGVTIADALANQPGIAIRSFGAGNTRPIVRGFDGDRVLIMQDGIRTGDLSSQSGDHGVSIDPASLERLEVVRGPATLLFGSNAIGGVVNAITPQDAFRASPFTGTLGTVSVDAGSANAQGGANASVQHGTGRWLVWAGGGGRRSGDYDTPAGTVENSGARLTNGRFGATWLGGRAFFGAGIQIERSRFGIPFAGAFHHHDEEAAGAEEPAEEHSLDVDIKADRRDFRTDAGWRGLGRGIADLVKVTFAYTDYGHDEIEIEEGLETLGTQFSNDTTSIRVELEQARRGRLSGRFGLEWFGRDYRATGEEALAPPTTQSALSAFVYEEIDFGRHRLQFGGRLERNAYDAGDRPESEHAEEHEHEPPAARDRSFVSGSGSVGVHADIGTHGAVVANLTAASRAPALEELYNFGPHVGNLAFEIGNPDLEVERTIGIDLSVRSRAARARVEANVFHYRISNFVFLDFTGDEADGLREAEFLQGDSRFTGVELSGSFQLRGQARLRTGVSYVRAKLVDTDEFLPRIPPLSGRVELELPWRAFTINPEIVLNGEQTKVFRDETATASSVVVNLGASFMAVRGHATHTVALKAYNLTNEAYRLHTSFIKDLTPEIGRGVRVSYTVRFF
jgi:iron complex outermembrane receptor protein